MKQAPYVPFYRKNGLRRYIGPKRILMLCVLAAAAIMAWYLWRRGLLTPQAIFAFIAEYPVLAPLLFVTMYAVFIACLIPSLPLNLGAGFLWGPLWGSLLTLAGSVLGTCTCFLFARTALGQPLAERIENRLAAGIQEEIGEKGWRVVALMCFNPAFPLGPLGYLFGLTSLPFLTYLWATSVFLYPLGLAYAWVGHASGSFAVQGDFLQLMQLIGAVAGTLALVLATRIVYRRMSAKRSATDADTVPGTDPDA
jgi:uncharacterized membrane protein YdjX (TVP38/TMEM64 family)